MIRTRFAPSPTGFLHIGGLRTALFAYLFAKKNKGKFILRIEDTDQSREVVGAKEKILKNLITVGIHPDESYQKGGNFGPYIQSERKKIYQKYTTELLEKDYAYRCFCTTEDLAKMRLEQTKKKLAPRYNGNCRKITHQETKEKLAKNTPYTVRLKVKRTQGSIIVRDLLRGMVSFQSSQIDDQILLKSDGFPTYHLACVVDDNLMGITHVIRGEEWLSSTPKHLLLYEYFGWKIPEFIHLPLLLSTNRSKLSKRHGDVAVKDYLKKGFLKTALINFIALLGWSPEGNREIFSLEELIQKFSLDKLGKSGAIFDIQKLKWINQQYIQKLPSKNFVAIVTPFISPKYYKIPPEKLEKMLLISQDNLSQLNNINEELNNFIPSKLDQKSKDLLQSKQNQKLLTSFLFQIKLVQNWQKVDFLQTMKKVQKQTAIKGKDLWIPIRLALTAKEQGPELPLIAEILGKDFCIEQTEKLIKN